MMTWKLSDELRPSRRQRKPLPRRAAPCAGLFGWRSEGEAPGAMREHPATKSGLDPLDHPPG